MRWGSSTKAICVFLDILATAICLALFLDSQGDKELIFLCTIVFVTDAACYAILFFTVYADIRAGSDQAIGFRRVWNFLWPYNVSIIGQFVCITCKMVFEVLIAVRFAFAAPIPLIAYFIPFWTFCIVVFIDLTLRLNSIRTKTNRR